jgi:hypothetical protein
MECVQDLDLLVAEEMGGSIAITASSWNMWFWTMSRIAPVSS